MNIIYITAKNALPVPAVSVARARSGAVPRRASPVDHMRSNHLPYHLQFNIIDLSQDVILQYLKNIHFKNCIEITLIVMSWNHNLSFPYIF